MPLKTNYKVVISVFFIMVFISIGAGFTYAKEAATLTVTANILNLRAAPNTSSKIISQLTKDSELKVISSSAGWYKVTISGKTGWVSENYVAEKSSVNKKVNNLDNGKNSTNISTNISTNNSGGNNSHVVNASDINKNNSIQEAIITGNNVNVRKGPGTNNNVIKQVNKGQRGTILDKSGEWFKVKFKDMTGWVSGTYVSIYLEGNDKSKTGTNTEIQNKSETSKSDKTAKTASESQTEKTGESGKTIKADDNNITTGSGITTEPGKKAKTETETEGKVNADITAIIDFAKTLLGVKYTYGGTTPETGFDCSGFVKYVFDNFDIKLNRVSADQAKQGFEVAIDELLPGDLVFFDTNGGISDISHVGLYIGAGEFINSVTGSGNGKVVIDSMNTNYWQPRFMTARRIIEK